MKNNRWVLLAVMAVLVVLVASGCLRNDLGNLHNF
jgi:hypothetical protein